jgi:hypothetical protein
MSRSAFQCGRARHKRGALYALLLLSAGVYGNTADVYETESAAIGVHRTVLTVMAEATLLNHNDEKDSEKDSAAGKDSEKDSEKDSLLRARSINREDKDNQNVADKNAKKSLLQKAKQHQKNLTVDEDGTVEQAPTVTDANGSIAGLSELKSGNDPISILKLK